MPTKTEVKTLQERLLAKAAYVQEIKLVLSGDSPLERNATERLERARAELKAAEADVEWVNRIKAIGPIQLAAHEQELSDLRVLNGQNKVVGRQGMTRGQLGRKLTKREELLAKLAELDAEVRDDS